MRIALLHYTSAPVIGGVERVLADHARLFAAHGHEVTLLSGEGAAMDDPLIVVRVLPELRRPDPGSFLGDKPFHSLRELLRGHDIVFLHNVLTMPFHLELTAALWQIAEAERETRFVAWVHDVAAANPDYAPAPALLSRAHPSIEYVAVSEVRRRELCAVTGLPKGRCRVIPNGIDPLERLRLTPNVRRLAEERQLLEREAVLLHPTRLLRRKQVETSLRITAEMVATSERRGRGPLLLITGAADPHHAPAADYAGEVRRLCAELQLEEHVCFVSDHFTPTDVDVDSLYTLADALLYPSRQEGFGLPVLEAALHRLPIFCRDLATLSALLPAEDITVFAEEAAPAEIAAEVRRQLMASRTIRNRKAVVRTHAWPAIYQNFLAPLLARAETIFHP